MRTSEKKTTAGRRCDSRVELRLRRPPYWLESTLSDKERQLVGDAMFRRTLRENGLPELLPSVWDEVEL